MGTVSILIMAIISLTGIVIVGVKALHFPIAFLITAIVILIEFAIVCVCITTSVKEQKEANVTVGTIAEKRVEYTNDDDIVYQFLIEYTYDYKGKTYDGERYVPVDKDVYLSYEIGDTYDTDYPFVKDEEG